MAFNRQFQNDRMFGGKFQKEESEEISHVKVNIFLIVVKKSGLLCRRARN